jgi:hypothetical protein
MHVLRLTLLLALSFSLVCESASGQSEQGAISAARPLVLSGSFRAAANKAQNDILRNAEGRRSID